MSSAWGQRIPGGYFDEEHHVYRNEQGVIIPSTTQCFAANGLDRFDKANQDDLEWKRMYGGAVHVAQEYMVVGDLDWNTLDPVIEKPVRGIQKRLEELEFEVEAVEDRRVVTYCGMQYGMTLDLIGWVKHLGKRRKAIIDTKTGSKYSKTWEWQLGGYLIPQVPVEGGWLAFNLQVNPNGEVKSHFVKDIAKAKREFQILLASTLLKINNGYYEVLGGTDGDNGK